MLDCKEGRLLRQIKREDKRICRFAPVDVLTLTIKITASRTEPTLRLLEVYQ